MSIPCFSLLHPWIPITPGQHPMLLNTWCLVTHESSALCLDDEPGIFLVTRARCIRTGGDFEWQDSYGAVLRVIAAMPYPDPYFPQD